MSKGMNNRRPIGIGIIGCGSISQIYMKNLQASSDVQLIACADIEIARAQQRAREFQIPHAYTVEQLLQDPSIELVINLTIPVAHAEVSMKIIEAGKHVYVEKPLTISLDDAKKLLQLAKNKGLRVGCAPDTFLGGGIQTCRQLIDSGEIGTPIAASAFMLCGGHETWHSSPEFYYEIGGGPMFDMGPYYLTALVNLLGPIKRVTGSTRISYKERMITSAPKNGQMIQVKTPTHIAGVIDFVAGPVATLVTSFDTKARTQFTIEIYGSEGTLSVPDPNQFGGEVRLLRVGQQEWETVALTHGNTQNARGIGVWDIAKSLHSGENHRVNGELAYHILEAMHGFHISSSTEKHYYLESSCAQPQMLSPEEKF